MKGRKYIYESRATSRVRVIHSYSPLESCRQQRRALARKASVCRCRCWMYTVRDSITYVHSSWLVYTCYTFDLVRIAKCFVAASKRMQFVTQLHVCTVRDSITCSMFAHQPASVRCCRWWIHKVRGSITHVYSSTSPWLHVAVDVTMSLVDSWVVSSWSLCSYHEQDITTIQETWVHEPCRDFYSLVRDIYVVITNSRHMSHRNRHESRTQDTWVIGIYMSYLNVTNSRHMTWKHHNSRHISV